MEILKQFDPHVEVVSIIRENLFKDYGLFDERIEVPAQFGLLDIWDEVFMKYYGNSNTL